MRGTCSQPQTMASRVAKKTERTSVFLVPTATPSAGTAQPALACSTPTLTPPYSAGEGT